MKETISGFYHLRFARYFVRATSRVSIAFACLIARTSCCSFFYKGSVSFSFIHQNDNCVNEKKRTFPCYLQWF